MMRATVRALLAALLIGTAAPAAAYLVTPLGDGRVAVELTTQADSRDEALAQARREAVKGSVGRVLMGDELIRADRLLERYLGNYSDQFISATEVLGERFVGGRNEVRSRVFVNFGALVNDLEEKQFLFTPAFRPRFVAFMTETLDGRVVQDGQARESITVAVNALGIRRNPGGDLATPPAGTDVSVDDFLLDAAIVNSQRAGVEVILTGESRTTLTDRRSLYFGDFWFYDTEINAQLIRVDTGEVLFSARGSGSASSQNQEEAIETAINRASERVAQRLVGDFNQFWPEVVQRESDFELLLTGVDESLIRVIQQNLERIGQGTQVRTRKAFHRTASLAVTTNASRDEIISAITGSPYPTMYVLNPAAERVFEVQVTD